MALEDEKKNSNALVEEAISKTTQRMEKEIEAVQLELSSTASSLSAELENSKKDALDTKSTLEQQLKAVQVRVGDSELFAVLYRILHFSEHIVYFICSKVPVV